MSFLAIFRILEKLTENRLRVLGISTCPSEFPLYCVSSYSVSQEADLLKYTIRSPVPSTCSWKPQGNFGRRDENKVSFNSPDSLPLKSPQAGCPSWKDSTTAVRKALLIFPSSPEKLSYHTFQTSIPREGNICFW